MQKQILISGAGIAGPALAFWLHRFGFQPTIVERFPKIREGGYIIDFWGVGYAVAERMGILPKLKELSFPIQELIFLGDHGETRGKLNLRLSKEVIDGRLISLLRSDLAKTLYNVTADKISYIFDDEIVHFEQNEKEVSVTFKKGGRQSFDLVVGADGLHSSVRSQVFGSHNQFERFFGYYVSSFTIDNFLGENFCMNYSMYSTPNKQVAAYSVRENKLSLFFIFKENDALHEILHDVKAQKEALKEVFKHEKWECAHFLEKLDTTSDFYFDAVSQVSMETWSKGRVILLGDAAYCPSLLSGQGAALAMAGAYLLAGELYKAQGNHSEAFLNYERLFKPFVEKKQQTAQTFVGSFVPSTHFKIWRRNQLSRFMNISFFSKMYWKKFLIDPLKLPDYESS